MDLCDCFTSIFIIGAWKLKKFDLGGRRRIQYVIINTKYFQVLIYKDVTEPISFPFTLQWYSECQHNLC